MEVVRDGIIHATVRSGNLRRLREIIESDPSCINDFNLDFQTPLQVVFEHIDKCSPVSADDRFPIMQFLIDHGANVNLGGMGVEFNPPLSLTIVSHQIKGIKFLLRNKADLNFVGSNNEPLLHRALNLQRFDYVLMLFLNYKADLSIVGRFSRTPLDTAIDYVEINFIKFLVASGAKSLNIYEQLLRVCMESVFRENCQSSHKVLVFLLSHATKVDSHGHFSLRALLYLMGCERHHVKSRYRYGCPLVGLLRREGIDFGDDVGDSKLHLAVCNGDITVIRSLLKQGAEPNVKNVFGDTPLHSLARNHSFMKCSLEQIMEIYQVLIEYGADLRAHNNLDETPFCLAVNKTKNTDLVKSMLAKIARVNETSLDSSAVKKTFSLRIPYDKDELKLNELLAAITFGYEDIIDRLVDIDYIDLVKNNYSCEDVNLALDIAANDALYFTLKRLLDAGFRTNRRFQMIHSYKRRYYEKHVKIACLLWEFKDTIILYSMMNYAFSNLTNKQILNKLTYVLVFYYAIDLCSNDLSAELIGLKGVFKLNDKLAEVLSVCNQKLNELKQVQVNNGISVFDIMTMPLDTLVRLLKNADINDSCRDFCSLLKAKQTLGYDEYAISIRTNLALEKRKIMDSAEQRLNKVLQSILETMNLHSLPDEIVLSIFAHLNTRDLEKLANIDKN